MYSARKPYLKLKDSMVDFFKSPAIFFKQFRRKFSQFEKPYLEGEYPQMHLNFPSWNWGNWESHILSPLGDLGPFNLPSIPRQTSPFPQDKDDDWKFLGCEMYIFPTSVEPGESYMIKFARGDDPIVSIAVEGPGSITATSLPGCTGNAGGLCTVYLYVDGDVGDWDWITITPTTATGATCGRTAMIEAGCDPTAVINYTTLQMSVDEEQGLSASESGLGYTWAISAGGGSLSKNEGNLTVYTAPSTNANCTANPTITLSCDGAVINSITIAINQYTGPAWAYKIWQDCEPHGIGWAKLMDGYNCAGTHKFGPNYSCSGTDEADCIASCPAAGTEDVRTQAMKDSGCCPEILI